MLIEIILNFILLVFRVAFATIQIENLPSDIQMVLATLTAYLIDGGRVICAYIHVPYILALLTFVIAMNAVMNGYRFLMWVLRKIPFLGID